MTDQRKELARLPQQSPVSVASMTTAQCRLIPATRSQGVAQLGACLTLVSPSGLTAEDRKEWLAVAMQTLSGIPADLLERGCEKARRKCRFPSEIVPVIMETIGKQWEWRKQDARQTALPAPEPSPEYVGVEEVRKLLKRLGA
jgi:hypothetical protein